MKFLHTMLRVKDIEKSLDFYEGLLGLKLSHTMDLDDCKLYFLSDNDGYTQIELTQNFETPKEGYDIGENFGHLAFETDDFESFSKKLQEKNIQYLYEPFILNDVEEIAFIKDPDENEIEIIKKRK